MAACPPSSSLIYVQIALTMITSKYSNTPVDICCWHHIGAASQQDLWGTVYTIYIPTIEAITDGLKVLPSVGCEPVIWSQMQKNIEYSESRRCFSLCMDNNIAAGVGCGWEMQWSAIWLLKTRAAPEDFVTWDFAHPAVVNYTVSGVKSPMKRLVLVEVRHPAGDVSGKGQSAWGKKQRFKDKSRP